MAQQISGDVVHVGQIIIHRNDCRIQYAKSLRVAVVRSRLFKVGQSCFTCLKTFVFGPDFGLTA